MARPSVLHHRVFLLLLLNKATALSVSSCTDLGWSNAATHGDTSVCAESDLGLGKCSGDLTYLEAKVFCTEKWRNRGRFCTVDELLNDEAQDAGCGYESDFLWSSDVCAPSKLWTSDGTTTTCADISGSYKVRCCADATYGLGSCSGLKKWNAGVNFCTSKGARLCTLTELQNFEPQGTGCNYERKLIWSSTTCTDKTKQLGTFQGYYQAWGSAAFGTNTPCVHPKLSTGHVRCCADDF